MTHGGRSSSSCYIISSEIRGSSGPGARLSSFLTPASKTFNSNNIAGPIKININIKINCCSYTKPTRKEHTGNFFDTHVCFIYIHEISEEADFFTMILFEKMNRRFSLSLKMLNESETEMERAYKSTDKIFDQRTYIVHTMNLRG